jgi:hypothetical protein
VDVRSSDSRLQGARRERLGLHRSDRDAWVWCAAEGTDIKKLVAQIFGEEEKPTEADIGAGKPADPQASAVAKEIAAPILRPTSHCPKARRNPIRKTHQERAQVPKQSCAARQ